MAYRTFNRNWDTNINTLGGARDYVAYDSPFSNDPSANNIHGNLSNGVLTREFKGKLDVNVTPSRFNMAYPQRVNNFSMNPQVEYVRRNIGQGAASKRRGGKKNAPQNKRRKNDAQQAAIDTLPQADAAPAEVIVDDIEIPLSPVEEVLEDIPILASAPTLDEVASQIADEGGNEVYTTEDIVSDITGMNELIPDAGMSDITEPIVNLSDNNVDELNTMPLVETESIPEATDVSSVVVPANSVSNVADIPKGAEVVELVSTGDGLVDIVDSTGTVIDVVPIEQIADVADVTDLNNVPENTTAVGDLKTLAETGTVEGFRFVKRRKRIAERYNPGIRGLRGSNIHISTERFTRKEAANIMIVLIAIIAFCMLAVCCGLLIPQIYVKCCGCGSGPGNVAVNAPQVFNKNTANEKPLDYY